MKLFLEIEFKPNTSISHIDTFLNEIPKYFPGCQTEIIQSIISDNKGG